MALNDLCDQSYKSGLNDLEQTIVKAADWIENTWFINEFYSGRHAESVAYDQLNAFKYAYIQSIYHIDLRMVVEDMAEEIINGRMESWPEK